MAPDDPNTSGDEGEGTPADENEATPSKDPPESTQGGTGPEADSDVPSADAGGAGQAEIDALIRGLDDSALSPTPEESPPAADASGETSSSDAGGVGQSEIDALIKGLDGSASSPTPEESPPASDASGETSSSDAGGVGQSEIDALISGLDDSASSPTPEESPPAADASGETSSSDAGGVGRAEIDALTSSLEDSDSSSTPDEESVSAEPAPEEILVDDPADGEPGLLGQSELDALIAEFESQEKSGDAKVSAKQKTVEAPAEAQEAEKSPEPPADSDTEEVVEISGRESDVDLLVAEASQQTEEKISADAPQDVRDPEIEAALLDLEDHAAEDPPVSEEEIASVTSTVQEGTESQQADAETAEAGSQTLSSQDDDTPIIDQPADELLVDRDMDERLDATPDQEEAVVPESEPEDLAVEIESAASTGAVSDVEADAVDESDDPASVLERVAGENVAAGAVENAQAPDAEPATPEVEASAKEDVLPAEEVAGPEEGEEVEVTPTARAFSRDKGGDGVRPTAIEQFRRSPTRVVASFAAGLLFALGAFVYFYANRLQSVSELALFPVGDAADLNRVLLHARELLDERKSSEAVKLLDAALTRAPEGAAGIDDARFLRMQGLYQGLPETIPRSMADDMHAQIDNLVETARSHPRAAEALYWKAKVYEREGNPIAARAEYRGILDNFGNAAVLDRVMLSLSELLLAAERPIQAAPYLQRVIQEYPGSPRAARARLYLGDAYAASGDLENARIVYIRLAESQANTSIGALAFERIGKLALESGDYSGAIRELESRLEMATTVEGNERIYLLLGKAYRSTGDLENARDILTELIDFFQESETTPSALVELSQVMNDMDLKREAVRMATQAVERFPRNIEVLRNAGELLGESGDAIAAARALFAAHSAGADDPELLLAAGRHFRTAGIEDDAVAAFQKLLELFPTSSQALEGNIEWARVLYARGDIAKALERLEHLTIATEGQPRRIPVLLALAEMYRDLGLRQEVAAVYAQIAGMAQEPELLAQAAIGLVREGEADAGMRVVERIDRSKLAGDTAYALMMAQAEVWLRRDAGEALEIMEEAHASYPEHRTPEGVQKLLEASLTTGQTARARALVSDLRIRAAQTEGSDEWGWLERAAIAWGDYLYERKDYRTALEAYTIALEPFEQKASRAAVDTAGALPSPSQLWSMYQRANSLLSLARFQESLEYYGIVAASNSMWAEEAETKSESARIEIRLRGDPVGETRNAG